MMRFSIVTFSMLILAGCMQKEIKIERAFDPKAAEFINTQGNTRIDGHAFLKNTDGRAKHAVGAMVWLIPKTPYAEERFARLYNGRKFVQADQAARVAGNDPLYEQYTRKTKAESTGRFTFENVASGEYYIATTITWKNSDNAIATQGGALYESVTITGKEENAVKVVVNGE